MKSLAIFRLSKMDNFSAFWYLERELGVQEFKAYIRRFKLKTCHSLALANARKICPKIGSPFENVLEGFFETFDCRKFVFIWHKIERNECTHVMSDTSKQPA